MKSMTPLFSQQDLDSWFDIFQANAEDKMMTLLRRAGEYFVKIARKNGKYIDHTGNLRSSIGYVIVNDGSIVESDFQVSEKGGTDKQTGKREAEKLALGLAETHNKGWVLIGVAGMEYAVHVEAIEGKDVVSGAYIQTEQFLRESIQAVFNKAYYGG
jgi:hypothetical protein|nr:MAG TPA: putative tail-component [Caudoviricetes sp.]